MQQITNLLLKLVFALPDGVRGLLATDKWLHLFMGVAIGAVVGGAAIFLGVSVWYGAAVAAVLGFLKELRDYQINSEAKKNGLPPPHGVEWLDFIFTAIGGAISAGVMVLLGL